MIPNFHNFSHFDRPVICKGKCLSIGFYNGSLYEEYFGVIRYDYATVTVALSEIRESIGEPLERASSRNWSSSSLAWWILEVSTQPRHSAKAKTDLFLSSHLHLKVIFM